MSQANRDKIVKVLQVLLLCKHTALTLEEFKAIEGAITLLRQPPLQDLRAMPYK